MLTPSFPLPSSLYIISLPPVKAAHFQELTQFSHVWVLFVFHENTNTDKAENGGRPHTCQAKIAPPRLKGKKVGCLSTRSPHRPNNLGLSVCEVLSVGDDYIDIRSIDFVHGTPGTCVRVFLCVWASACLMSSVCRHTNPLPLSFCTHSLKYTHVHQCWT